MTLEEIEAAVEPYVLDFLRRLQDAAACEKRPLSAETRRLEDAISEKEAELNRLAHNLAQIAEADVVQMLAGHIHAEKQALAALQRRRDTLLYVRADPDLDAVFAAVPDEWPEYSVSEKKQIAHAILARVLVHEHALELTFCGGIPETSIFCG